QNRIISRAPWDGHPVSLLLYVAWCVLWPGAFLLFYPFSVLIHELGHASAALLLTPHHVQVRIGQGQLVWSRRCGRLELRFHRAANPHRILFWDVHNATSGSVCLFSVPPQHWRHVLCALAGPGASLLLAAACARLA